MPPFFIMIPYLKILLSLLLFVCLLDMPYGYYELVRIIAMTVFAFFGYHANKQWKTNEMFLYIGLSILFQPFYKVALGRELWNIIDVIVGLGLLASITRLQRKDAS